METIDKLNQNKTIHQIIYSLTFWTFKIRWPWEIFCKGKGCNFFGMKIHLYFDLIMHMIEFSYLFVIVVLYLIITKIRRLKVGGNGEIHVVYKWGGFILQKFWKYEVFAFSSQLLTWDLTIEIIISFCLDYYWIVLKED